MKSLFGILSVMAAGVLLSACTVHTTAGTSPVYYNPPPVVLSHPPVYPRSYHVPVYPRTYYPPVYRPPVYRPPVYVYPRHYR
jgi:hypothetical protein